MEFRADEAEERYAAFVEPAASAVVGLDFDGTLSPIVEDPTQAHIHPDAPEVLVGAGRRRRRGRGDHRPPARQALALGGLDEVGDGDRRAGRELLPASASTATSAGPRPGAGSSRPGRRTAWRRSCASCPAVLRRPTPADAFIEDKGLAVAVHTRRLADPDGGVRAAAARR